MESFYVAEDYGGRKRLAEYIMFFVVFFFHVQLTLTVSNDRMPDAVLSTTLCQQNVHQIVNLLIVPAIERFWMEEK